jgi:Lipopolysaccharide kinase (Kdo/WaaP) family
MAYLTVHPSYRQALTSAGLTTPESILELQAVCFCGHPDRNVSRARLKTPDGPLPVLIKREHAVRWRERVLNACAGFGFASKSCREAQSLSELHAANVSAPDWIAHGEDARGRAFLIIKECTDAVDLRIHLADSALVSSRVRSGLVRRLALTLARMHAAGIDHPDLYSKHVLIDRAGNPCIIDWQRTPHRHAVSWRRRLAAIAKLHATTAPELASARERVQFLAAYLRCTRKEQRFAPRLIVATKTVDKIAKALISDRRLRELQQVPDTGCVQRVIWCDGEALCITPQLLTRLDGHRPSWLYLDNLPSAPMHWRRRESIQLPGNEAGDLTRRRVRSWSLLLRCLLGKSRPNSPELREAGVLFRLERFGLPAQRLLAFGQRSLSPTRLESFILREIPAGFVSFGAWLREPGANSDRRLRWQLLRASGELLRRLHDACFFCWPNPEAKIDDLLAVVSRPGTNPEIVVGNAGLLVSRRRELTGARRTDLRRLMHSSTGRALSRTDRLRFLLAYRAAGQAVPDEGNLIGGLRWKSRMQALVSMAAGLFT